MPTLYVPVGIPGSGKTTYGKSLKNCVCLSSDKIRGEFFGDESLQYTEEFADRWMTDHGLSASWDSAEEHEAFMHDVCTTAVFEELHDRTRDALMNGKDVYYDATNLTAKNRRKLLQNLDGYYDKAVAVYFDVPYAVCEARNASRDRVVPESVLSSMQKRMTKPTKMEGFDDIMTIGTVPEYKRNSVKFLILGRTASGKDTLREDLSDTYGWKFVTSCTTRPKRSPDEDTHIFVTPEEADAIPKSEKAAWTKINGAEYFATATQVNESDGYIIDPRGAKMLMNHMPDTKFHIVYLTPASIDLQKEAALSRVSEKDKDHELKVFEKRYKDENDQFTKFEEALASGEVSRACEGVSILTNDYKPETIHTFAEKLAKLHMKTISCDDINLEDVDLEEDYK